MSLALIEGEAGLSRRSRLAKGDRPPQESASFIAEARLTQ